ncbi:MAG: T9SS type A sorting domain-containing protein [Bacteroidetes bacterium]|nr:T9SS type A sorting domain-containing protein [Bacteroidota bacterium]
MKKSLLAVLTFVSGFTFAQNCSKIFISEYVEGWSNNKAIEIYNPTSVPVNLNEYFVSRYSNGATTATVLNSVQLSGTIAPFDVYVAVLDKQDENGTGQEAPIWDSLQARADGFYSPVYNTSNAFYWNGNDAVMLAKGTLPSNPALLINATNVPNFAIIDIFGKIGENPANETGSAAGNDGAWSTQFPYSSGQGVLVTKDHSMIRKASIEKGVSTPVSFFDPMLEWDTIPPVIYLFDENGDTIESVNGNVILFGNWFSLGSHDCSCNPVSMPEMEFNNYSIFPNPTEDVVTIKLDENIKSLTITNSLGQSIWNKEFLNKGLYTIELPKSAGVYFVHLVSNNGTNSTEKILVK